MTDKPEFKRYAQPQPVGDWAIDISAGRPILVYQGCSVIEAEQAYYVLGLINGTVPPAGGEPVVYALSRYNDSGGFSPSMVPRESLPEPETREGYVTEEDHRLAMQDNIKLQSELTKAREALQEIICACGDERSHGYISMLAEDALSNQSAPADNLTRAERVEQLNQEIATLLAEDDHEQDS